MNEKVIAARTELEIIALENQDLFDQIATKRRVFDQLVSHLTIKLDEQIDAIQKQINANEARMKLFMEEAEAKETKTQRSLQLLSCKIELKKPVTKIVKPNNVEVDRIIQSYPEYAKVKTTTELDWKSLKGKLIIEGDKVVHMETGEDMQLQLETEAERIVIK